MKWHKISDGDYLEYGEFVFVAFNTSGEYRKRDCVVSRLDVKNGYKIWNHDDGFWDYIDGTDRWAYIDLPVD